jgi:predicted PurR-regulated permease PerM
VEEYYKLHASMLNKIEISHRTIIFTAIFVAAIWFILQIREILFLLFIAFILMAAIRPTVDALEKRGIPSVISILFIYILVFGVFGVSLVGTIPSLVVQFGHLTQAFPSFIARVIPNINVDLNAFSQQIAPLSQNLLMLTVSIFSNIITIVTVLVFTFYLLLERKHTESLLASFMADNLAKRVSSVLGKIESRMGAWVQGQLFLMFIIGIMSYVGLWILKIDFVLPLAILAGLLEIVPTIGPIISAIPAVIIGFSISPVTALLVAILFFIIHQSENTFIVPFVMKKSVGLPPILTIIALMIGGKLAGIAGAVLAVPVVLVVQEILHEVFSKDSIV